MRERERERERHIIARYCGQVSELVSWDPPLLSWGTENRPPCTRNGNRDSTMNDVIEVWSRSGENLEAIACIVLEIQCLEAWRVG